MYGSATQRAVTRWRDAVSTAVLNPQTPSSPVGLMQIWTIFPFQHHWTFKIFRFPVQSESIAEVVVILWDMDAVNSSQLSFQGTVMCLCPLSYWMFSVCKLHVRSPLRRLWLLYYSCVSAIFTAGELLRGQENFLFYGKCALPKMKTSGWTDRRPACIQL